MPIQPLAPTLRLNSRENDPLPPSGENVPAAISCCRKARTSCRSSLASRGSSTGSKRKLYVIWASRSCGDERPELVGAAFRDHAAETRGPHRFVAELLAPRPQPARRMMQRMLVGKAHRTMHLVRDRGAGAGRLAAAHFGYRDLAHRDLRQRAGLGRGIGGGARRRHLSRKGGKVMLDRLELRDRAAELHAIERILDRLFEDFLESAGHLLQPDRRPETDENVLIYRSRPHGLGNDPVERDIVARLAGKARPLADRQIDSRDQRHRRRLVSVMGKERDMAGSAGEWHAARPAGKGAAGG